LIGQGSSPRAVEVAASDGSATIARFIARDNRFVVRARLEGGEPDGSGDEVRAYLPNTARLADVLVPDAHLILEPNDELSRRTRWTVTRVWDGTWVALEANAASRLVADHLEAGGLLPDWPGVVAVRREVAHGRHRFDLEVDLADGHVGTVEVKSLSRARHGVAPLSSTPSTRGVAHLEALTRVAAEGRRVAVVFVVQRGDVDVLDLEAPADPAWTEAVRTARAAGVRVVAFACDVDRRRITLGRPVTVLPPAPGSTSQSAGRPGRAIGDRDQRP
jgi:sugar fermentation stimulation protein